MYLSKLFSTARETASNSVIIADTEYFANVFLFHTAAVVVSAFVIISIILYDVIS